MGECGRRSSRLEKGERGEDWCWPIGVQDGVYSGSGTAYEVGIGHIEKFPFFIHELFGNI